LCFVQFAWSSHSISASCIMPRSLCVIKADIISFELKSSVQKSRAAR
jgi:hypothetical protein